MKLELDHETLGAYDVLTPHGEVDLASYGTLRDAMTGVFDAGRSQVVVDLASTTFLDSSALGCLIGGRRRAEEAGGSFTLLVDAPNLVKLLTITRLDEVFEILPDRAAWSAAHGVG